MFDNDFFDSLNEDVRKVLPFNYNFEVSKTVRRIRQVGAKRIALQFPEGLLAYSIPLSDIISRYGGCETAILSDVTYGACCVEDLTARAMECDFLVHYGHSCLISIKDCVLPTMMYVFVDIGIDVTHFVETILSLVPPEVGTGIALFSTIQFVVSLRAAAKSLKLKGYTNLFVPQVKPLSCGEVLGCTSPRLSPEIHTVIFLGDGRFHLESMMIANETAPTRHAGEGNATHTPVLRQFYQYNPYTKLLTTESYDHGAMKALRKQSIDTARGAEHFAIILGTLGRQGSPYILKRLQDLLKKHQRSFSVILMCELSPAKVASLVPSFDAAIQIACPRLSVDWGAQYPIPLLTPYEAEVMLGEALWVGDTGTSYPMDHYALEGGSWAVYTTKPSIPSLSSGEDSTGGSKV